MGADQVGEIDLGERGGAVVAVNGVDTDAAKVQGSTIEDFRFLRDRESAGVGAKRLAGRSDGDRGEIADDSGDLDHQRGVASGEAIGNREVRSEEHTSELQ